MEPMAKCSEMRELIPLKLPQQVEEQRKKEEGASSPLEPSSPLPTPHSHQLSQSSIMSDLPSPTFSNRGHSRMQSSNSSLPSSPTMLGSAEIFGSGKRPLTDVKEEPLERDEDFEMIDSFRHEEDSEHQVPSIPPRLSENEWSLDDPEVMRYMEYRCDDEEHFTVEYPRNPIAKRQRADASPLSGFASKMGSRMPSFSRKWRSRKASPSVSIPPLSREASVSRANSTRALSISSAHRDTQTPPTPAASIKPTDIDNEKAWSSFSQQPEELDSSHHSNNQFYNHAHHSSLDSAENDDEEFPRAQPSTPLLPPLMTEHLRRTEEETPQSPLQSPKVAEPGTSSVLHSPVSVPHTPAYPSPPLSTRPSVASFRHVQRYPQTLVPSSEIPPIAIADASLPRDKWADTLGHANFTILPEPYTPEPLTYASLQQVRSDRETAYNNFTQHLERVEENNGPMSKTHELTRQKWGEIDAAWQNIIASCNAQLPPLPLPVPATTHQQQHHPSSSLASTNRSSDPTANTSIMPSSPPLQASKFPDLGDQEIVGPMEVGPLRAEVVKAMEMEREKGARKRKLGSYIRDWIQGLGRRD